LKDQSLKNIIVSLALASLFAAHKSEAVSLDDIQFWTGIGTNRAALVVEWSTPETFVGPFGSSTVPAPIANKSLVWGYRFNGTNTGTQMLKAILAADPTLAVAINTSFGTYVEGICYRLSGAGISGLQDATQTNYFTDRFLTNVTVDIDAAGPVLSGDLYWGGYYGPNWEMWTETGASGGFTNAPDRGTNTYWTAADPFAYTGSHGEWELAQNGLDGMNLKNGSWVGFSVAASPYHYDLDAPYNTHKRAPAVPDAGFTAPPVQYFTLQNVSGKWQGNFDGRTNWVYALERSTQLQNWITVTNTNPGANGSVTFEDTNSIAPAVYYRIRAERP
jgi:hypothetical protein